MEVQPSETREIDVRVFINMIEEAPVKFLPIYFDQYVNLMVARIMKKMGFFPTLG